MKRFITARKRSLRRLCFYRCLSFILFTGGGMRGRGGMHGRVAGGRVWQGGRAWRGGVRGFIQLGGHAWFYSGGHAWFYSGGHAWFYPGGHAWFYSGGGVRGFFSFSGYNEIRSMSGRYASYWNAFLYLLSLCLDVPTILNTSLIHRLSYVYTCLYYCRSLFFVQYYMEKSFIQWTLESKS